MKESLRFTPLLDLFNEKQMLTEQQASFYQLERSSDS